MFTTNQELELFGDELLHPTSFKFTKSTELNAVEALQLFLLHHLAMIIAFHGKELALDLTSLLQEDLSETSMLSHSETLLLIPEMLKDDLLFKTTPTLDMDILLDTKFTLLLMITLLITHSLLEEVLTGDLEHFILMELEILTLEIEKICTLEEPSLDLLI